MDIGQCQKLGLWIVRVDGKRERGAPELDTIDELFFVEQAAEVDVEAQFIEGGERAAAGSDRRRGGICRRPSPRNGLREMVPISARRFSRASPSATFVRRRLSSSWLSTMVRSQAAAGEGSEDGERGEMAKPEHSRSASGCGAPIAGKMDRRR